MSTILIFLLAAAVASATVLPSGGVTDRPWVIGQPAVVQWDPAHFEGRVSIDLWSAAERRFIELATDVDATTGRVEITVPHDVAPGRSFRVRIAEIARPHQYDMSAGFFPIRASFMVEPVTSVRPSESTLARLNVSVAPNPVQEVLTVRWSTGDVLGIRVYTVDGTTAAEMRVTTDMREVDIQRAELAPGLYVVEAFGPGGAARTTVVLD
jgi:hypothetical protein